SRSSGRAHQIPVGAWRVPRKIDLSSFCRTAPPAQPRSTQPASGKVVLKMAKKKAASKPATKSNGHAKQAQKAPQKLQIRMYQVGFGDCFLLTFKYSKDKKQDKHVLVDFGTTAQPDALMVEIANDIAKVTGGKLTAVVATHRHRDHISGFATG